MANFLGPAITSLAREFGRGASRVAARPSPVTAPSFTPALPASVPFATPQAISAVPKLPAVAQPNYVPPFSRPASGSTMGVPRGADVRSLGNMTQRPDNFTTPKYNDPFANSGGWTGGGVSAVGGEWATLDGMNSFIADAGMKTGVPPNLIKAMLAREGAFGTDKNVVGLRGEEVYAFNGIFRSTAQSYGIDFDRMTQDDSYAVWAMGKVLSEIKNNNPELGTWDNVAKYYFSGPNWQNNGWTDEVGNTVDNYAYGPTGVITRMKYLDSLGGGNGGVGGGWNGDWSQSFGQGAAVHDWGEFGVDSDNGYYGYGTQYGLNGRQHTGLDITGGWNSTYRSPVSGTVTCAGTGNGAGADGGGCSSFNTMDGKGGAGRIEVQLDNGAVLIFGHSQGSFVQAGQRINAGDALGTIGFANSDHIHLEARVRDPNTASGWRIVDPRTVLGGGWGGGQQEEVTGWRRWLQ